MYRWGVECESRDVRQRDVCLWGPGLREWIHMRHLALQCTAGGTEREQRAVWHGVTVPCLKLSRQGLMGRMP